MTRFVPVLEEHCWMTHMEDLLSQGCRLHTADETKQQVHHGRGVNVFQHQTDEALLLLEKSDQLENRGRSFIFAGKRRELHRNFRHVSVNSPETVLLLWYLLSFPGDEIADGFAEEACQERVERRVLLQEVIEDLQERLVPAQFVVNYGHI